MGVVDKECHAAKPGDGFGHHGLHLLALANVARQGDGSAARIGNLGGGPLTLGQSTADHGHRRTFAGQREGYAASDALPRPGDDRHPPGKRTRHQPGFLGTQISAVPVHIFTPRWFSIMCLTWTRCRPSPSTDFSVTSAVWMVTSPVSAGPR